MEYFYEKRYRTAHTSYSSKHFGELVSNYSLDKRVTQVNPRRARGVGRARTAVSMRRFPPYVYVQFALQHMYFFYLVYLTEIHHLGRELLYVSVFFFGRKAVGGRLISEDYGY